MAFSGGSVGFTGSIPSSTYGVTYTAPTYSYPSNSTNRTLTVSSAGPSSIACTGTASQTYHARYYWPTIGDYVDDYTTISGTAPACPVAPPDTSGRMNVYNGSSWVKGPAQVFNGSSWVAGTVYVYNGSSWVKSV